MNKRLSATDYILSIVFIFLLVCIAGAFFFGFKIGTDKAEARYSSLLKQYEDAADGPTAYEQQVLVSFYHTIFTPYREYQIQWFDKLDSIGLQNAAADPSSSMKALSKLADDQYKLVQEASIPANSPLLQEAQNNYMKSLRLFADTAKKYESEANRLPARTLLNEIENDPFFQEAKNFGLKAQHQYYESILEWNKTVAEVHSADAAQQPEIPVPEWNGLPLNVKNAFVAGLLENQQAYSLYYPQDISLRIDELIATGQAGRMNLDAAGKIAEMLISTGAVRSGDFIQGKERWYSNETLPQIPFFFENK